MKNNFFKCLLLMFALLAHLPGRSEDIDLFMGVTPSDRDLPNVLIVLDNTANWSSAFTNEMSALRSVVNGLDADKFNVGLMLFSETGNPNSNVDGAYVRAAIRRMDSANKIKYVALVDSLRTGGQGDQGSSGKAGKAMEEAYRYFAGAAPHYGNNKVKTDYGGNTFGNAASTDIYALPGNALASAEATRYTSPIKANSCAKNYIIYISNGAPSDSQNDSDTTAWELANTFGGSTTKIELTPEQSESNMADEWARFMKASSLGITVYTVDVDKEPTGQRGPGWTALLKSMAIQSRGKYFDVAAAGTQIQDALNAIFSEIQSVSSVFASVSLPVSANTQGDYLDQVFIGMFLPDKTKNPRWTGNLKQYKLGLNGNNLQLQDADSAAAINNSAGEITACARSFWSPLPSASDTEWASRPSDNYCLTYPYSRTSNSPDGNVVEKGGQAYVLRSGITASAPRNVKTCSGTCADAVDFNSTNVSASALGVANDTERDAIIAWVKGQDNLDEDQDTVLTDNRLTLHGDVVHSRPVAINFGSAASPSVVVFYGGNDGMLRAINGNRSSAIGDIPAGGELWSFMPPEFYTSINRLRANTPNILFPSSKSGLRDPLSKPYGMDGAINAYKGPVSVGGPNRMFLYATMRRGGRAIYGFDVSNTLTAPTTPGLLWKIGCPNMTNDTGCSNGTEGMGQTWSAVKPFTAANFNDGVTPLIIMGGGYDNCEDYDNGTANHNCTRDSKGHYVYVFNGLTGNRIRTFDTGGVHGIVADVTIATDAYGKAKYGYTADLGGNVYRITFGGADSSGWTMKKIASLGCDTLTSCAAPRKFMFAPSVAEVNGNYAVMIGSGDREKPLNYFSAATSVANLFFMFTDKPDVLSWPGTDDCGGDVAIICKNSLFGITTSATPSVTDLAPKKGWYLALAEKEQVVTSAITIYGTVSFRTHFPPEAGDNACKPNLGEARSYNVNYANAAGVYNNVRSEEMLGGGLGVSGVGGVTSGRVFCIGCGTGNYDVTEPPPPPPIVQPKGRLYWYLQR